MNRHLPWILGCLLFLGCSSTRTPASERPEACTLDEGLAGVWKSSRSSQLGPARMRFDLRCDCTYTSKVGLIFTRIVEEGYYRSEDGEIVLIRPSAETRWPYELRDGKLHLTEAPGEVHDYRRVEEREYRSGR